MATKITGDVIALSTIQPNKFTPGAFSWDAQGNVYATKFVGDGLTLTGLTPAASAVNVPGTSLSLDPSHNNAILYFNNNANSTLDIGFNPEFIDGHKTTVVQEGLGQVIIQGPGVVSQSGYQRTRTQYSVVELEYLQNSDQWSLYGDLGIGETYSLSANRASVDEGSQVTIQLITTNVANGNIPYTVTGTINSADLSATSAGMTGNFNVVGGLATVVFRLSADSATEGTESINLQLNNGQASISVPVNDTSINTSYSLSRSAASVNEGQSVTITLNTVGIGNGTLVPYTVTGINGADLSSGNTTGNFTINSNTATQVFTFANDALTEGNETMVLTLSNGAANISVTIVDTSTNPAPNFTQIAAGASHSLALSGTNLFATGYNSYGGLGLGNTIFHSTFTQVSGNWTNIAAGNNYSLALSGTKLFAVGANTYGSLGLGNTVPRSTFTRVAGDWTAISSGTESSLALSGTKLFATGWNFYGQLGLGDTANRFTFTQVPGDWTSINAGVYRSFALSGTKLFATGDNGYGELGLGDRVRRSTFTQVPGDWTSISAGAYPSLALSGTKLFATGNNFQGQLGLGDTIHRSAFTQVAGNWTSISAGYYLSLALSGTKLFATGWNPYGGLGIGNTIDRSTFTQVAGDWTSINAGAYHSLALSGTKLFDTGRNDQGQLGLNDATNRLTFTQVLSVN